MAICIRRCKGAGVEFNKVKDVKPYRPSNGTEGECFIFYHCQQCKHDNPKADLFCDILTRALTFKEEDAEYPKEWIYDEKNEPTCTKYEYEERRDEQKN